MSIKVCFLGSARYTRPLDQTAEKKFRAISSLGEVFVVGFSSDLQPLMFTEHAHFYLLPKLPLPMLRYVELLVAGQLLILWLIFRHRIQVVIAQSPYEGFVAALAIKFAAWFGYKVGLAVEVHGERVVENEKRPDDRREKEQNNQDHGDQRGNVFEQVFD
jgi:hypothetical protein